MRLSRINADVVVQRQRLRFFVRATSNPAGLRRRVSSGRALQAHGLTGGHGDVGPRRGLDGRFLADNDLRGKAKDETSALFSKKNAPKTSVVFPRPPLYLSPPSLLGIDLRRVLQIAHESGPSRSAEAASLEISAQLTPRLAPANVREELWRIIDSFAPHGDPLGFSRRVGLVRINSRAIFIVLRCF